MIEFDLFRSTAFTAGTMLIALQNFAMYALLFEMPIVVHDLLGLDAEDAGRILVTMMIAVVVAAVVAGRLTDLLGARSVAITGSLLAVVGMVLLRVQDLDRPSDLTVPLVVLGIGLGAATPAAQAAAQSAAHEAQSGMAAGVMSTMRYLGGVAGVAVLGAMLGDPGAGSSTVAGPQIVADHRALLLVFGAALVASAVCAAVLPGRVRGPPSEEDAGVAPAHGDERTDPHHH